jgi:putative flippase GtrA
MTETAKVKTEPANRATETRRFASFAVTGGLAAACNLGSRMLLSKVMRYELAIAAAYLIGMIVAFLLARRLVFEASEQPWRSELLKFSAVNLVSFAQVWLVSVGLVRILFPRLGFHWHTESTAHLIGVESPLVLSYYAHKYFTFKPLRKQVEAQERAAGKEGSKPDLEWET